MTSTGAPPTGDAGSSRALDATSPHPAGTADDRDSLALTVSEHPPTPSERLLPGTEVGEYLVEEMIGEGGFGAVYAARHPVIGKRAAIKVLSKAFSSDADLSARFVNEARAVNTIRHKNIVDIFAFGRLKDQRLYFIMEILEGEALDSTLRRKGRLELAEAMPIFRAIARALDATHAADIVHRDLKPANIFLAVDGEGGIVPKLLDFGIAKVAGNAASSSSGQTKTGTVLGTPWYMSPEQCRGEGVGPRADVYSFGVILHRALTGHLPFEGTNAFDVAVAQATQAPPPMSAIAPDLPPELDAPVLRMLAKDSAERPASPGEALDEFAAVARSLGLWGDQDTPGAAPPSLVQAARIGADLRVSTPGPDLRAPGSGGTMPGTEMWAPLNALRPQRARSPWRVPVVLAAIVAAGVLAFTMLRDQARVAQADVESTSAKPTVRPAPAATEPPLVGLTPTAAPAPSASSVAPAEGDADAAAAAAVAPSSKTKTPRPKTDETIPKDFDTPTF